MNKIQTNFKNLFPEKTTNTIIGFGQFAESIDVFEIAETCIIPENFENEFFNYEVLIENDIVTSFLKIN